MRWNYGNPGLPGNNRALDWYAKSGLKAMAATAAQTRWPVFPRNNGNVGPIREFCQMTAKRGLDGILCTAWDDDSPHMAYYWRGWTPFADFSWNSEGRNEEEVLLAFAQRAYGIDAAHHAYPGFQLLEKAMNFWDTALITSGRRNVCYDATMNGIIDLPTLENREDWLKKHAKRLASRPRLSDEKTPVDKFYQASQVAVRNRDDLRLSAWLSALSFWSEAMLSAFERWAKDPSEENLNSIKRTNPILDSMWENYLAVYSKSRILNNPPGYILDQNHHAHQANSSNRPEWMIAVELKFQQQVEEWLKDK